MPDHASDQPGDKALTFERTEVKANIDRLIGTLEHLCQRSPPGVWVSSTDMILEVPDHIDPVDVSGLDHSVAALTVLARPEHASLHGACRISENVLLCTCTCLACHSSVCLHNAHVTAVVLVVYRYPFYLQGEFAQIIHVGGSELVKSCIRPDGKCEMVGLLIPFVLSTLGV